MSDQPFLIGSGAGFSGDRVDAAIARRRGHRRCRRAAVRSSSRRWANGPLHWGRSPGRPDPAKGYEPLLEQFLAPILAPALAAGITIVGNFGAANPPAAARAIPRLAEAHGLSPRIAVVSGDDCWAAPISTRRERWDGDAGLPTPKATSSPSMPIWVRAASPTPSAPAPRSW